MINWGLLYEKLYINLLENKICENSIVYNTDLLS